jgi:hypothetical protein
MSSINHFGPGVTVPDEPNNLPAPLPEPNSIAISGNKALTEVQKNNIAKYEESVKYGFTPMAGPMVCRDDKCPYFDKCPLVRNSIDRPMGEDCPVEAFQIKQWTEQFSAAAAIDPDDPSSAYDRMLVDQIVFQMTLEARAAMQLALDPRIERKAVSGYSPTGQPFYATENSKAAEFYEKLVKTKLRIMRELLTTRKSKADAASKGYADPSKVAAHLMEKAKKIRLASQHSDGSISATEIEMHESSPKAPEVFGE